MAEKKNERKIEKTMTKEWLAAGEDEPAGRLWHLVKTGVLSLGEALGEAYYDGLCTRSPVVKVISFDPTNPHDVCPLEHVEGPDGETWTACGLESGSFCDRPRHCILKELGGDALVKVEKRRSDGK